MHLNLSADDGYRDLSISVPADATRPPISQITLNFEPGRDPSAFKLDRIIVRGQ